MSKLRNALPDIDQKETIEIRKKFDYALNALKELRDTFKKKYGDTPRLNYGTKYKPNNIYFHVSITGRDSYNCLLFSIILDCGNLGFSGYVIRETQMGTHFFKEESLEDLIEKMLMNKDTQKRLFHAVQSSSIYGTSTIKTEVD